MSTPFEPLIQSCPHLALSDTAKCYGANKGMPLVLVNNPHCRAVIAQQGAQLLECETAKGPLLWLSPQAIFNPGKAIRGGVPVCLPWFGPHSSDPKKPQHGICRNQDWHLSAANALDDGRTELVWCFDHYCETAHPQFEFTFGAQLTMILGAQIDLALRITNTDNTNMPVTWALHSYHPVSDLSQVRISGLENCDYLDNTRDRARTTQQGAVRFNGELDRVYVSVPDEQIIETQPRLAVQASNSGSAIVWNPGTELAAGMADVGEANHLGFVCLERGDAADNALDLAPGDHHSARVCIRFAD
jgi:D-hexose-6-phosphate mutarotase